MFYVPKESFKWFYNQCRRYLPVVYYSEQLFKKCKCYVWGGEQGWRSGESARLPPMWPGFKSRRPRHMWVEFAGGFSPGTPVFPSPEKPTFPNSNSTRNQVDEEPLCGCASCKSLFIYLFFILFMYGVFFSLRPLSHEIWPSSSNTDTILFFTNWWPYYRVLL